MMKKDRRRAMSPSVGYVGSSTKTNYFTNRPKTPFSRIKQIYGENLERFELTHDKSEPQYEALLIQRKREIRLEIKEQITSENKRNVMIICFLVVLVVTLILVLNYFIPKFL